MENIKHVEDTAFESFTSNAQHVTVFHCGGITRGPANPQAAAYIEEVEKDLFRNPDLIAKCLGWGGYERVAVVAFPYAIATDIEDRLEYAVLKTTTIESQQVHWRKKKHVFVVGSCVSDATPSTQRGSILEVNGRWFVVGRGERFHEITAEVNAVHAAAFENDDE